MNPRGLHSRRIDVAMKLLGALAVVLLAGVVAQLARGGHEFPIYPSYYPHEIRIQTLAPDWAAALLVENKIQAYVGGEPQFAAAPPDSLRPIESLGAFVIVRVNPASPLTKTDASACDAIGSVIRDMASRKGAWTLHPYPVTPFHGDYLDHADLAEAAKTSVLDSAGAATPVRGLKVRASSALTKNLVRPQWLASRSDWDIEIEEASAADLVASASWDVNGWPGPADVRSGWFQAALLLAPSLAGATRDRVQTDLVRLRSRAYGNAVERINLERELVAALAAGCRARVAGYTVKREYISAEYSAGIENIGFDAIAGLDSPIFIRTVKLKDFPWNGWLSLGVDARPTAAWNPVAGFNDGFGRLMWSAMSDPALLPAPYDAGWMLNRISDVQQTPAR